MTRLKHWYVVTILVLLIAPSLAFGGGGLAVFDGAPKAPHQKIGELEVSIKSPPPAFGWTTAKVLTFGWVKGPSRAEQIKKRLRQKLKKAGRKYQADAIAEINYSPNPGEATYFRTKDYYARGALIKYSKFPESQPQKPISTS